MAGILQQTGFVDITEEECFTEVRFSSGEGYFQSLMGISGPIQNLFTKLSDAQKTDVRDQMVASIVQYLKAGRVGLLIVMRMITASTPC